MTYLLRVVLPDRPGALGAVATALGAAGVDIEAVDVVERGNGGYAVDDLIVRLPPGGLADVLITAAESVADVEVESLRPHPRAAETIRDLQVVDALAANPEQALTWLATLAPQAFSASWALVLEQDEPDAAPTVVTASPNAPQDVPERACSWLPLSGARRLEPSQTSLPASWLARDVELTAAPIGTSSRVLLIARHGGPMFRPGEVMRLGHLSGLAATVLAASRSAPGRTSTTQIVAC